MEGNLFVRQLALLLRLLPANLQNTPDLTRGNRKSKFHELTWKLTSKSNPTSSHVVNGSIYRTQLLDENLG